MQARNHIPFAMSCWWLFAIATKQPLEVTGTMTAAVGGLLPDLDHPKSALGRQIPIISVPLSAMVGHRGVTHSLFAVVILLVLLLYAATLPLSHHGQFSILISPLIVGYLSHIFGDSLTPSGVPLLWPKKKNYSFNLFKTWSWQETVFVGLFTIATVILCGVTQAMTGDIVDRLPLKRLRL